MISPIKAGNLERMWRDLKEGAEKIYTSNTISKNYYLELYTIVYKFCNTTAGGSIALKTQLYKELTIFIRGHVQTVYNECEDLIDEPLLLLYVIHWQDYCLSSKVLNGVYGYFNKYRVRNQDMLEVYNLALVTWKDYLLKPLKKRIFSAVLTLIERERQEETVNGNRLISITVNSYIEMNYTDPHQDYFSQNFYQEAFEAEFLVETESCYVTKSASIIRENTVSVFMEKIVTWFTDEERRARLYLHETTMRELMRVLQNVLIIKYIDTFYAEFKTLLAYNKIEDLKRMYHILRTVSGASDQLGIQFEEQVTKEGLLEIEKYNESGVNDPKAYINILLDVNQRFNCIVKTAFESEVGFVTALNKACEKFINKNAVTESSGSSSKSAELLAKYCDFLLKKKSGESEEMGIVNNLNQAMIIFKYIEKKDIFQSFYSKLLAKRLVQQINMLGNDDAEMMMISKLKEACGFDYTIKLQDMFKDVCVSRKLIEQFKQKKGPLDVDFSIIVIKSSAWPFNQAHRLSLPQELENSVQQFTAFYFSQYNGRTLSWVHGMSKGELISKCFDKPYIFQASAFQMAVLLQFNTQTTLSVNQLQQSTAIRYDILLQVLQALTKLELLKDANENPLTASSSITLNLGYQNKKMKVNINVPMKSEIRSEWESVHQQVEKNRKLLIQAAIVRIGKVRKVVEHQILLSEVVNQMAPRFKPKIRVVKECIDILIEKGYFKRVENDSYCYIA